MHNGKEMIALASIASKHLYYSGFPHNEFPWLFQLWMTKYGKWGLEFEKKYFIEIAHTMSFQPIIFYSWAQVEKNKINTELQSSETWRFY